MAEPTVIHLPELPQRITREQALAALEILGLPSSVSNYELDCTDGITVGLLAHDSEGRRLRVGDGPAIITVQIPFANEQPDTGDEDPAPVYFLESRAALTTEQCAEIRRRWRELYSDVVHREHPEP